MFGAAEQASEIDNAHKGIALGLLDSLEVAAPPPEAADMVKNAAKNLWSFNFTHQWERSPTTNPVLVLVSG
jgi:hypothetical protein